MHPSIITGSARPKYPVNYRPLCSLSGLASLLVMIWCGAPDTLLAARQPVPVGRWQVQDVEHLNNQNLRGSITYIFAVTLKAGAVGSTSASMEYQGTPINDGLFKGRQLVRGVISRPVTKATRADDKLLLYSGGTFKLAAGEPSGHTIKEYATLGGLFPEATIDKLLEAFYGVMVFTISGDDLVFVPKGSERGKAVTWKKVQ